MGLRKIFAIIFVTAICLTQSSIVRAKDFNRELLDGVVYIQSVVPITSNPKSIDDYRLKNGTGFFVGNSKNEGEFILTSCSVISDFINTGRVDGGGRLYASFDKNDLEEVYYVDSDVDSNVAILRLGRPTEKRIPLPLQPVDESSQGKPAYTIGFPIAPKVDISKLEALNPGQATVTGGSINRILFDSKTGTPLIQFDASVNTGNSGGPLVDENGLVIGVCAPLSTTDKSLNYAVNISTAIPLLEKNSIPYTKGSQFPVILFVLLGVALVSILALIVILLISNKRQKPVTVEPVVEEKPAVPLKKAFLCSRSAQHPSLRKPLSANPVTIGRDQRVCGIIFKKDTPGVSGKHCQVSFDSQTQNAVLMDVGSTYGTFAASGQKLNPNVPNVLKQGDGFYLGDPANSFYIEMENV